LARAAKPKPQTKLRVGGKRYLSSLPLDTVAEMMRAPRANGERVVIEVRSMDDPPRRAFVSVADAVAAEEYVE
jgi:hypothetical protein